MNGQFRQILVDVIGEFAVDNDTVAMIVRELKQNRVYQLGVRQLEMGATELDVKMFLRRHVAEILR